MDAVQLNAIDEVSKSLKWLSSILTGADHKTAQRVTESARLVLEHILQAEKVKNLTDHGRQLTLDL